MLIDKLNSLRKEKQLQYMIEGEYKNFIRSFA